MWNKISQGSPYLHVLRSSTFINTLIEIANAWRSGQLGGRGRGQAAGRVSIDTNCVEFKNKTGSDLARGDVVQLGVHVLDEIYPDHPRFEANLVDEELGVDRNLAIVVVPCKNNMTIVDGAQVSGRCLAKVNVTDILHTHAYAADGETVLVSGPGGPIEILSDLESTGEQDVWVNVGSARTKLLCKATATLTLGSITSGFQVWDGNPSSGANSGITSLPAFYSRGDIMINEFFTLDRVNGDWLAVLDDNSWLGKADAAIAAGASGTVSLWTGTPGSETDSSVNATSIRNRTSVDIPSGGWVHIGRVNGKFYGTPWSC